MNKIHLYSLFHANLQFSSIPEEHHKYIIELCYWPLLELNKKYPLKCGMEFSGYTLERIDELDRSFIRELKELCKKGKIEIIGSSYSQTIFPLIPAVANQKNIQAGNKVYNKFFNIIPGIFYLNEQVFSKSLVDLYAEENIKTIVIDWDNTKLAGKLDDKYKYELPLLKGINDRNSVRILWNRSISFQKFQRYLFNEITLEEYLIYLSKHLSSSCDRCFLWYGSDLEILDYKPGMIDLEYIAPSKKTIERLERAIELILDSQCYSFELPASIVEKYSSNNEITINSAEYPIICKKQAKYNVSRWAVCGRSNSFLNRECYTLFKRILSLHSLKDNDEYWKKLNFLWGSDFRTFASDKKIINFYKHAGYMSCASDVSQLPAHLLENKNISFDKDIIETDTLKLYLNLKKGCTLKKVFFKNVSTEWLFGTISHDLYEDIRFSTDQYSGHFIAQDIYGKKHTDISCNVEFNTRICYEEEKIHLFTKVSPDKEIELYKSIYIYRKQERIEIEYHFNFFDFQAQYIRMGIITFNPAAFDIESLSYATHNGGFEEEAYFVRGTVINQIQNIDNRFTSSHCLGATEGFIKITDKDKEIKITVDKGYSYLVPLLHFEEINNTYYFRIYHSMAETDETSKHLFRGQMKIKFLIDVKRVL